MQRFTNCADCGSANELMFRIDAIVQHCSATDLAKGIEICEACLRQHGVDPDLLLAAVAGATGSKATASAA